MSAGDRSAREVWLGALVRALAPSFAARGFPLPDKVRVSCGWPGSGGRSVIGEAWSAAASADGSCEIFVSPELADSLRVGDVLVHELCHVAVGNDAGHRGPFRRCAVAMGLRGPMTSTVASPALVAELTAIVERIGPYPHATLARGMGKKKQGTRMRKVQCPACGYLVRTTSKWLDVGVPTCPCGEQMEADDDEDGDED